MVVMVLCIVHSLQFSCNCVLDIYLVFSILYSDVSRSIFLFKINGCHQFDYMILQFEFDGEFVGCLRVWSIIINETKQLNFHFVIELLVILGRWELRCNQQIIDYMFILEMIFPFAYSLFTIQATNLNLNIIWFRFYRRLLRVYIFCIFDRHPLRLRCVDLTPYCRQFTISTIGFGYVFEIAIEERVIL